jgi:hypothetical protein
MKDKLNRWALAVLMTLSGLVLGGCKAETEDKTSDYLLPMELSDCKVYQMSNAAGASMFIVRCPNSATATTYRSGKTNKTTLTIDGITYAPVTASEASQ